MRRKKNRRSVLAGLSGAFLTGLTGCLSGDSGADDDGDTDGSTGNGDTDTPTDNGDTDAPTDNGDTDAPTDNGDTEAPTVDVAWGMYGRDARNTFFTDHDGPTARPDVAWSVETGGFLPVDPVPVIADETVYVPDSRGETAVDLRAVHVADGDTRWETELEGSQTARVTPALYHGTLYAATAELFALDPETGEERWQFEPEDSVTDSEFLCLGSDIAVFGNRNTVLAIDLADESVRWQLEPQASPEPPAIADGEIYVGSRSPEDGFLASYSRDDGSELWSLDDFAHGGTSAPAIEDGVLYYGDSFETVALETNGETERWRYELGGTVSNPPAVDSGSIFYPGTGRIARIDAEEGRPVWVEEFDDGFTPGVLTPDTFYTASSGGIVYAFDREDGSIVWQRDLETRLSGAPAVANDTLYIGDRDGVIYALR